MARMKRQTRIARINAITRLASANSRQFAQFASSPFPYPRHPRNPRLKRFLRDLRAKSSAEKQPQRGKTCGGRVRPYPWQNRVMENQIVRLTGLSNQEFLQLHARPGRVGLSSGVTLADKVICRAQRHLDEQERWG